MKTCSVEECDRNETNSRITKGYCSRHYTQIRRHGRILVAGPRPDKCKIMGCDEKNHSYGYCRKHAYKLRTEGYLQESKVKKYPCKIEGCNRPHNSHGYCQRHFKQMKKFGKTWSNSISDPNNAHYYDNKCYIELRSAYGDITGVSVIDIDDSDRVLKHKWCMSSGYATTVVGGKTLAMHALVMGRKFIDHIDRDPLNNCKANLRKCTHSENLWNTKPIIKSSKYKGVSYDTTAKKYLTKITCNKNIIWGGRYSNEIDAALAYNELSKKYHGEFGVLNELN